MKRNPYDLQAGHLLRRIDGLKQFRGNHPCPGCQVPISGTRKLCLACAQALDKLAVESVELNPAVPVAAEAEDEG